MNTFTETSTTDCNSNDIVYSFTVEQGGSVVDFSSFLTFDLASKKFTLNVNDETKVGTYIIKLNGKITANLSVDPSTKKEEN